MLAVAAAGLFAVQAARADYIETGDVEPITNLSTWTNTTVPYIGKNTNGALTIDNGSTLSTNGFVLGYPAAVTGIVTVTGSGSNWAAGTSYIGYNGIGDLNITNGGIVSLRGVSTLYAAVKSGSTGSILIDGSGSTLTTYTANIGYGGTGALMITNGGSLSAGYTASLGTSVAAAVGRPLSTAPDRSGQPATPSMSAKPAPAGSPSAMAVLSLHPLSPSTASPPSPSTSARAAPSL
jgi:T5SS/PEP-CTERM-associated repeat protein